MPAASAKCASVLPSQHPPLLIVADIPFPGYIMYCRPGLYSEIIQLNPDYSPNSLYTLFSFQLNAPKFVIGANMVVE
jgi:hypothetical protein